MTFWINLCTVMFYFCLLACSFVFTSKEVKYITNIKLKYLLAEKNTLKIYVPCQEELKICVSVCKMRQSDRQKNQIR